MIPIALQLYSVATTARPTCPEPWPRLRTTWRRRGVRWLLRILGQRTSSASSTTNGLNAQDTSIDTLGRCSQPGSGRWSFTRPSAASHSSFPVSGVTSLARETLAKLPMPNTICGRSEGRGDVDWLYNHTHEFIHGVGRAALGCAVRQHEQGRLYAVRYRQGAMHARATGDDKLGAAAAPASCQGPTLLTTPTR